MDEDVRLALLMLFKMKLDEIYLINGVNSEEQRSVLTNAITRLESLAPKSYTSPEGRPIISMPERRI